MSINEGMDEDNMVHIHDGILLGHEKNEIMPLQQHGWTQRWSYCMKSDRERQISCDIAYTWDLKKMAHMNLLTKQPESHTHTHTYIYIENKHGYQQWGAGGGRRKCKLGEQD